MDGVKPLDNRIIIKQVEAKEKTASGIILPDSAKERPLRGEVLAVGPRCKDIKVGDIVLYGKYAHQPFEVDGIERIVINEPDVIAILTE